MCLLVKKAYNKYFMLSTPNILKALSLIFRETLNNAVHILGAKSTSDKKLSEFEDNAKKNPPKQSYLLY